MQALLGTAGAAACGSASALAGSQDWNVLVLCSDEHNADVLGVEGHPDAYTPNLDRLAGQGMMLNRCYVASPVCAPTRQSWLTGLHPSEHGQLSNMHVFDPRNATLMHAFQDAGFETACFGKLHTQSGTEVDGAFGFDTLLNHHSARWAEVRSSYRDRVLGTYSTSSAEAADWANMPFSGFTGRAYQDPALVPDWVLTQEAAGFLGQTRTSPFLCYLSLRAPHYPFWLPDDFYGLTDPASVSMPVVQPGDLDDSLAGQRSRDSHRWDLMTEAQHRLVRARYLDSVSFMDEMMGQMLDELDRLGLAENTIVLYLSDHGEMMGEKGLWLKHVPFQAASRKPAILRMPGVIPPATRANQLVSEVDILPTLLGLAGKGTAVPGGLSGRDLSQTVLLEAAGVPQTTWARSYGVRGREVCFGSDFFGTDDTPWMSTATDGRHNFVRYETDAGKVTYELYDLQEDPSEETSVADDPAYAGVLDELDTRILEHQAGLVLPEFPPLLKA